MMYVKTINGRDVVSDCHSLRINNRWVSNPSHETILQQGWSVYVPPPQTEPNNTDLIQAMKRMLSADVASLTDEDALGVAAMFPTWASKLPEDPLNPKPSDTLPIGERVWYDGKLWKVTQAHVPQSNWTPDTAVSLFVEVSIAATPAWVQPNANNAYMTDDQVTHNGHTWKSEIDNNVWEPGAVGSELLWTQID